MLTPDEFEAAMRKIFAEHGADLERAHGYADELMCNLLIEMGYGAAVGFYLDQERWYA